MSISSAQCRAARGLLDWTQDQLATNARVSRATVADFERNLRLPVPNNLRAIEDCLFALGVEFIPERGDEGVGVRFRERKLQYRNSVRIDTFEGRAWLPMTWGDEEFDCVVRRDTLEDHFRLSGNGHLRTQEDYTAYMSEILHVLLATVERRLRAGHPIEGGEFVVTYDMLESLSA